MKIIKLHNNLFSRRKSQPILLTNQSLHIFPSMFTGSEQRLTWAHKNSGNILTDSVSAGIPSYVIQEEFCRFQGFWWQPSTNGNIIYRMGNCDPTTNTNFYITFIDGIFRILYEEVDESDVGIVKFPSFNGEAGGMEEYRC